MHFQIEMGAAYINVIIPITELMAQQSIKLCAADGPSRHCTDKTPVWCCRRLCLAFGLVLGAVWRKGLINYTHVGISLKKICLVQPRSLKCWGGVTTRMIIELDYEIGILHAGALDSLEVQKVLRFKS